MYSDVKSVGILISLLKEYNIKNAVLSSGTCSIPILHSLEIDTFFECYSDIDERSAVYFAMGISQAKKEPVAVVCTSGTAACNYLPGVCEAYKANAPLVIITCDKDPNTLNHMTIQKVNQHEIFGNNCKYSVTLPVIKDRLDEWAVKTYICQALLELDHHGRGPVHINIYTDGDKKTFNTPKLPKINPIKRINYSYLLDNKLDYINQLVKYKRILVVCGEQSYCDEELTRALETFSNMYNIVIVGEPVSNLNLEKRLNIYPLFEQITYDIFERSIKPDLVISMGGNFASYEIKTLIKSAGNSIEHWWIDPAGQVVDTWKNIKNVFEMSEKNFFKLLNDHSNTVNDNEYYNLLQNKLNEIVIPNVRYSSLDFMGQLSKKMSKVHLLHLGILNSTRLAFLYDVPKSTRTYSNLGALGIDGSLSSFLGQASKINDWICLCVLGDLSFIYDINSLYKTPINNNVKIVLLNNGGGSEFHLNTGIELIPELDDYISAGHSSLVGKWAKENGLSFYKIISKEDYSNVLDDFINSESASILEVCTDIENDAKAIKEMYRTNGYSQVLNRRNAKIKKILTKIIGIEKTKRITMMAKIWLGR